jgi:hypothetical protein
MHMKLLISTMIAGLSLANVPAQAGGFDGSIAGGLIGGIAGGLIAGAIASQGRPYVVYRRYAPRPRVVIVHALPVVIQRTNTILAPVAVPVLAAPAPASAPTASVMAPIIINNAPAPAPAPAAPPVIIVNVPSAAPAPPPVAAAVVPAAAPGAVTDHCQRDFPKTEDYLACLKGLSDQATK